MSDSLQTIAIPRKSLLHVTGLLLISRGAGWALGIIREVAIAAIFGATRIVDAFAVANIIPTSIYAMLQSVLASTLIPHYISVKTNQNEAAARHTIRTLLTHLLLLTSLASIVVLLFAPQFIHWLAPTFSTEDSARAVRFLRILIVGIVSASVFFVLLNIYQIYDKWARPALGPLIANSFAVGLLVIGSSWIGPDALAWSWLAATLILPILLLSGKTGRGFFAFQFRDPNVGVFYRMALPLVIENVFALSAQIVNRYLASGLPEGELSSLAYAQRIHAMCGDLVIATLIPAIFPRLVESAVTATREMNRALLEKALLGITLVMIGAVAIIAGTALPLVEVIFERGAFTVSDSARVASIILPFSVGLIFSVPLIVLYRAFFAVRNTIVPTVGMFIAVCIIILLSFLLIEPLGTPGLGVASMIGMAVEFTLLSAFASRFGVDVPGRKLLRLFLLGLVVAMVVAGALHWADQALRTSWEIHSLGVKIVRLTGLMGVGAVLFYYLAMLFRLPGFTILEGLLKTTIQRFRSR